MKMLIPLLCILSMTLAEPPVGDGYPSSRSSHEDHHHHEHTSRTSPANEYLPPTNNLSAEYGPPNARTSGRSKNFRPPAARVSFSQTFGSSSKDHSGAFQGYEASNARNVLSQEYGLPNSRSGLSQEYGLPNSKSGISQEYGLPNSKSGLSQEYGLPNLKSGISQEYGLPNSKSGLSREYGLPNSKSGLSQEYGVPSARNFPSDGYSAPESRISQEYGTPNANVLSQEYDLPNARSFSPEYSVPDTRKGISQEYGTPSIRNPAQEYGLPSGRSNPSERYGAPDSRGSLEEYGVPSSPAFTDDYAVNSISQEYDASLRSPSEEYGTPIASARTLSTEYGVPDSRSTPSQEYGLPELARGHKKAKQSTRSQLKNALKSSVHKSFGERSYPKASGYSSARSYSARDSSSYSEGHKVSSSYLPAARDLPNTYEESARGLPQEYGTPSSGSNLLTKAIASSYSSARSSPSSTYGTPSAQSMPSEQYGVPEQYNSLSGQGYNYARAALDEIINQEPANYDFSYKVNDYESGSDFGHTESRQENHAEGSYFVVLPDGNKQTVEYEADERGFKPRISVEPVDLERSGYDENAANLDRTNENGPF